MLASECSSGCESGWTLYLDHSFLSSHRGGNGFVDEDVKRGKNKVQEEEEEDLSMVSDASSGPPHFQEDEEGYCNDDNGCFYPPSMAPTLVKNDGKRQKVRTFRGRVEQEDPSFLDDTASSPLFNFSKVSQYYSEPTLMNQRLRCGDFLIHFLLFFFYQFHRTKTRLQWRACWIFLKASPQPT